MSLVLALLALAAPQADPALQAAPQAQSTAQPAAPAVASSAPALSEEERRARDRRLSFPRAGLERARADLERATSEAGRIAALTALGAAHEGADLARIGELARAGSPRERAAATLALGEFGAAGLAELERLAPEAEAPEAPDLADELAAARARAGGASEPAPAAAEERRLELRWRAAKRYGSVDGVRYADYALGLRKGDPVFLARLVVSAARGLEPLRVRGHLLELLREDGNPALLRDAAGAVPRALDDLFAAGEWSPRDAAEWAEIVAEVDARRRGADATTLLQAAFAFEGATEEAAGLALLRARKVPSVDWVEQFATRADRRARLALFESAGDLAETWVIPILGKASQREPDPETEAVSTLAMARLGFQPAVARCQTILEQGATDERREFLRALGRAAHDRTLLPWIQRALEHDDLAPEERFELELADAVAGGKRDHGLLFELLERGDGDPRRIAVLRALATAPDPASRARLAELFPDGDDEELDLALALALLEHRDGRVLVLLRSALWRMEGSRSLIAGGVLLQVEGLDGFLGELAAPPLGTRAGDLRRAGFALGEFAGLSAVETLARGTRESNPVLQGAVLGALSVRGALEGF